jgi:hypothetical protein
MIWWQQIHADAPVKGIEAIDASLITARIMVDLLLIPISNR